MFIEQLISIWSAPNFLFKAENDGAMLCIREGEGEEIITFTSTEEEDRSIP